MSNTIAAIILTKDEGKHIERCIGSLKGVCDEVFVIDCFSKDDTRHKHEAGVRGRFRTQAHLTGAGGHSLGKGVSFFYSTDNDSAVMRFKRGVRQTLRWVMPWWWV